MKKGKIVSGDVSISSVSSELISSNKIIVLAIIDAFKSRGQLEIVLRGHRDYSKNRPEICQVPTTAGMGNFVHIINYAL